MKELKISTKIEIYNKEEELRKSDRQLLKKAKENLFKSYAPYSRFMVSAALLLEDGTIITGANLENASFSLALCAERTTLATAASDHPGKKALAMAITVKSGKMKVEAPVAPCGACRQVLVESEKRLDHPIRLILQGESGDIYIIPTVKNLLPLSFNGEYL